MNTEAHAATAATHAAAGHADEHGYHAEHAHGSLRGYLIGFGLSVVLTAIPFWLVMNDALSSKMATAITITVFAAVQIVVHMIYFLHMSPRSEEGWNMMALIFTIIVVFITMAGTLWVMYHLNVNMMPTMHDMSQMP